MFNVHLAKKFGAKVIAVTRKTWLKDFCADLIVDYEEVEEKVREFIDGKMADVVINSLGEKFWDKSLAVVGVEGKIVTFGTLLGAEVKINLNQIFSKNTNILGVSRGNKKDFLELLDLCMDCKVKIWKKFKLQDSVEALKELFSPSRDGRILISTN
jgi:NADPH:quinone reductase-like Zn-dependent oxidoreductase